MEIVFFIIFTVLGLSVGSFLNLCIDRLPAGGSLVLPPSHCDSCQRRISSLDNIPVFSYLWLHGRCRYCGARITPRVLVVEVLGGALFFLAFWRFGLSAAFPVTAFWSCVFLVIIFIDWEHQLILNKVTYPAAMVALVILGIDSLLPQWGLLANVKPLWPGTSILSGLMAGAIGSLFFLIVAFIKPGGMGIGDVKLAFLIGLATGFPLFIVALMIGIVIGGLVAAVLLALRIKGRKDLIAYGAFLGIGPIAALLWGNEILNWYLHLY